MTLKIVPITDLRRRTADVIRAAQVSGDAVYITRHGRPIAVLVEYECYERLLQQSQQAAALELPASYTDTLAGLHREIWEGVDTDAYLQQERGAWERPTDR